MKTLLTLVRRTILKSAQTIGRRRFAAAVERLESRVFLCGSAGADGASGMDNLSPAIQLLPATIAAAQTVGVATAAKETISPDDVTPAAATALMVDLPSGNVLAGGGFAVSVDATDPTGQLDPTYSGAVTLSLLSNAGAALNGTLTVAAVGGIATFNSLSIDNAGAGYMIEATAASLAAGVSPAFAVYTDQFVVTRSRRIRLPPRAAPGLALL